MTCPLASAVVQTWETLRPPEPEGQQSRLCEQNDHSPIVQQATAVISSLADFQRLGRLKMFVVLSQQRLRSFVSGVREG
jgi:hypothetical protein